MALKFVMNVYKLFLQDSILCGFNILNKAISINDVKSSHF